MNLCDSTTTTVASSPLQNTTQYVHGNALPDTDAAGLLRTPVAATDPWVLLAVVVLLIVLLLVLTTHSGYWVYRVKDFFASERKFADVPKQTTIGEAMTYVVPLLTGIAGLSLLVTDFTLQLPLACFSASRYLLYGITAVAGICFLLFKIFLYGLVNWVFFDTMHGSRWLSSYLFLTSLFAALFLPMAIIYLYTSLSLATVSNCLLTVLILYKILIFYKMNTNFQTKNYGKVLVFLYFCTLEILPLLVTGHFFLTVRAL